MSGLFISYRRDDQAGFAGRLADALESAFGADNVFRDMEDIRPGDDFVIALHQQLHSVDLMLVVIGPAWLSASRNGVRRLDEADDFVRMEIETVLRAGKPVLPVLVGGAAMPTVEDLPTAIRALARRQAIVLSDAGWSSDVPRLVESIRPLLAVKRGISRRWGLVGGLAGIALLGLLAAGLKGYWPDSSTNLPIPVSTAMSDNLTGRWAAQVTYDWGAVHEETFAFKLDNDDVHGTASYLRVARTVEQGRLQAGRLSFVTHTQEEQGGTARDVTHRYRGEVKAGELHFVLESSGGHSSHTPVEFIARRVAP